MANKTQTAVKTASQTTTRTSTLNPLEEKVLRMRHGFELPDDKALETMAGGNLELEAKLLEIEKKIIEAAGPRSNASKRKIVQQLKRSR